MYKYYKVLDLPYDAPLTDIKRAYRNLVFVWHPDRFAKDAESEKHATERFVEINEAYRILRSFTPEETMEVKEPARSAEPIDWSQPKTEQANVFSSHAKPAQQKPSRHWHWSYGVVGVPLIGLGIIFWLNTKPTQIPKTSLPLPPPVPAEYLVDDNNPETPTPGFQQISANSSAYETLRDSSNSSNDSLKQSLADSISFPRR